MNDPCERCGLRPVHLDVTSTDGERYVTDIDACIAPMVQALNRAGIATSESCCGHGENGAIFLHDGRTLAIEPPRKL